MLSNKEKSYFKKGYKAIAGIDEVGRGCLAGPVAAAAVVIRGPIRGLPEVKDSKKLSEKQREAIFEAAKNHPDVEWTVSYVGPKIIDKINIGQATVLAWQRSLGKLKQCPDFLFLDGNQTIPHLKVKQEAVVKGDQKIFAISLASVMAKVSRDRLMKKLSNKYPDYGLEIHKGYGTQLHMEKIKKHGVSQIHRRSFRPVFDSLSFSDKVLRCVSQISNGQTMSYREIAKTIGQGKDFEAVERVLNRNIDPKIPCHRIIRSSGLSSKGIKGYNKGTKLKKKLLASEGVKF